MARILMIGGGCRGRELAGILVSEGHAVRMTTREERNRPAIEALGAECWIGDPDRLTTLRQALDSVTIACWLLGNAGGDPQAVAALHGSRLEFFLGQLIDTTVRGLLYEAAGRAGPELLQRGGAHVRAACELNAIPFALLHADPADVAGWVAAARAEIDSLLG